MLLTCKLVSVNSADRRTALLAEVRKVNPSVEIIVSGLGDTNLMVRRTASRVLIGFRHVGIISGTGKLDGNSSSATYQQERG